MNKYTFVVKSGKCKNHIIDWVVAETRAKAIEKMKQSLIDAGLYAEADGVVWKRNFIVKKDAWN